MRKQAKKKTHTQITWKKNQEWAVPQRAYNNDGCKWSQVSYTVCTVLISIWCVLACNSHRSSLSTVAAEPRPNRDTKCLNWVCLNHFGWLCGCAWKLHACWFRFAFSVLHQKLYTHSQPLTYGEDFIWIRENYTCTHTIEQRRPTDRMHQNGVQRIELYIFRKLLLERHIWRIQQLHSHIHIRPCGIISLETFSFIWWCCSFARTPLHTCKWLRAPIHPKKHAHNHHNKMHTHNGTSQEIKPYQTID